MEHTGDARQKTSREVDESLEPLELVHIRQQRKIQDNTDVEVQRADPGSINSAAQEIHCWTCKDTLRWVGRTRTATGPWGQWQWLSV
jgi:hypothetical protein